MMSSKQSNVSLTLIVAGKINYGYLREEEEEDWMDESYGSYGSYCCRFGCFGF